MTAPSTVTAIEQFLAANEQKALLRLSTAGSVDDGKSTLIGRLLYDSKGVYEDQIASVRKASVNRNAGPIDFSLLTDGLRAEREQGITIDVAYRYFSTPRRKFIIADTPGHEQYTRNMATGASTAHLAIILIDARNGVLPQSRRHAFIAGLLGTPHIAVAVNKMDLVDFRQDVFEAIRTEFTAFLGSAGIDHADFFPISALDGDNVVERSPRTPWYSGPSLLDHLESVPVGREAEAADFRFPVQLVLRPNLDFRGYAGQVASGVVRAGDPVMALPGGRSSRIKSISTYDGDLAEARPPMSVTLTLEDEIDISRGDMLVHPRHAPQASRHVEARVVWMHETPLEPKKPYLIKHTTQTIRGSVAAIRHRFDVNTLAEIPADSLRMNEIGAVLVETTRPLFFDPYRVNHATGAFILIDPLSNATVAAGMITGAQQAARRVSREPVSAAEREAWLGHKGGVVWLHGPEELAARVERRLFDRHVLAAVADAAVAGPMSDAGVIAVVIAPDAAEARDELREAVGSERLAAIDAAELAADADEAAIEVCHQLESRGWIQPWADPFTGGDGI